MKVRTLLALAIATLGGAAAYAESTNAVGDTAAPFSTYNTYAWTAGTTSPDAVTERRIHAAVEAQFSGKGVRLAEPDETPLIYVATHVVTDQKKDLIANGFAPTAFDKGGAAIPALSKGMLVVDVYDATSKKIVWRGVATGTGSDGPTKNADRIERALADMFKQLPVGLELPK
jgi:Domain of unknown function (DUF4136)